MVGGGDGTVLFRWCSLVVFVGGGTILVGGTDTD